MTEEIKDEQGQQKPAPKRKKKLIITGAVVAAIVVIGAGFWAWHETPGFCAAICHTPMDEYLVTYEEEVGVTGTDKFGNTVADTSGMLAPVHRAAGDRCMDCHAPVLSEQVTEAVNWAAGHYVAPLYELSTEELVEARGVAPDEFCSNEKCHGNITRSELYDKTAEYARNPHDSRHGDIACSTCHKAHRASVMYCTECHSDAEVPEGWISAQEAAELNMGDEEDAA